MSERTSKANVSAGFMKISNNGTTDDRLVKATSDIAPVVQLHDMKMDGEVMKMFEVEGGIPLPAGQTVELKPKSLHIMFMKVAKQPGAGTSFRGTLTFEKAGTVEVEVEGHRRSASAVGNGPLDAAMKAALTIIKALLMD